MRLVAHHFALSIPTMRKVKQEMIYSHIIVQG